MSPTPQPRRLWQRLTLPAALLVLAAIAQVGLCWWGTRRSPSVPLLRYVDQTSEWILTVDGSCDSVTDTFLWRQTPVDPSRPTLSSSEKALPRLGKITDLLDRHAVRETGGHGQFAGWPWRCMWCLCPAGRDPIAGILTRRVTQERERLSIPAKTGMSIWLLSSSDDFALPTGTFPVAFLGNTVATAGMVGVLGWFLFRLPGHVTRRARRRRNRCERCGYDLSGLPSVGSPRCPECNHTTT